MTNMKFIAAIVFSLVFAVSIHAESTVIKGEIKFAYSKNGFGDDKFEKEFGGVVKAKTDWRAGEFFGKETVFAGISVNNTGPKPMFYNYYVAFFDKDRKLVGAAGQGSFGDKGLEPGKETQLGSCLIHLPKDKYKEIKFYEAVIYETDVAPKKD